jgi:hypothetical protein
MNLDDLGRLSGFTVGGPAWPRCGKCGETGCLGPDGGDVPVSDIAIWIRDHRCPDGPAAMPAREAVGARAILGALGAANQ